LALTLGPLALACGPTEKATYVWVDVASRPAIHDVTRLEVTVRHEGESISKTFGDGITPLALPASLTVTPHDHIGTLAIEGVAFCAGNIQCARGSVTAWVAAKTQPRVTLQLEPDDFQVNTTIADAQILVDAGGRSGRQVAAASDGRFVTVFENITTLGRYDALGRLFGADAVPRENAVSHTTGDFILNQGGSESVFFVTVASARDGTFLAAWADLATGAGTFNARAFDAAGTPSAEVILSANGAPPSGPGHVAAFPAGGYVAVWQQARSSTDKRGEVRIRLLDAQGRPRTNAATGTTADFLAAPPGSDSMEKPAVAVGPDQAFLVVWIEVPASGNATIKGRLFAPQGEARGDVFMVATVTSTFADAPNVAGTLDGYLIVWSDTGAEPDETDILLRHVATDGTMAQPAYRVNANTRGYQVEPAIAVDADGHTLVVWTDSENFPEDPVAPSIRARALHSFGLPIGTDVGINTTALGQQWSPSVAALGQGSFVVIWEDLSQAGPDVDSSGIRGRVVYPNFAPNDGGLGSLCLHAEDCAPELTCVPRGTTSYCHVPCTDAEIGQPCPFGGMCTATSAASAPACLFR